MLRGFTDSTGVEWRVWEVFPSKAEAVSAADTFTLSSLKETAFKNGWLCFESTSEKRRLAPIPEGWEFRDVELLERLCSEAMPVKPRVRTSA